MSRIGLHFLSWLGSVGKSWLPSFLFMAIALPQPLHLIAQGPQPPAQESHSQMASPTETNGPDSDSPQDDYRIGPEDSLQITVFEAPDLAREVRVSRRGEITLPPLGVVKVGGLTSRQLELALEDLLRRTYVKNPHVGVTLKDVQSHPVFVFGMVSKPGMFQVRTTTSLVEVLSMAGGILDGAGDSVVVVRGAKFALKPDPRPGQVSNPGGMETSSGAADAEDTTVKPTAIESAAEPQIVRVGLRDLLESGNAAYDISIYAGDIVTVPPPLVVYIVGDVAKPGGYPFKNNESLWQMMALAGGPTATAKRSRASIIRLDQKTGDRREIPIDLNKILLAKSPGPPIRPNDILYVPTSGSKRAMERALGIALSTTPGIIVALSPRF